jgi:hypothetical protein
MFGRATTGGFGLDSEVFAYPKPNTGATLNPRGEHGRHAGEPFPNPKRRFTDSTWATDRRNRRRARAATMRRAARTNTLTGSSPPAKCAAFLTAPQSKYCQLAHAELARLAESYSRLLK